MHAQPPLGNRNQPRPRRCVPDPGGKLYTVAFQSRAHPLELRCLDALLVAEPPARHYGRRSQNESNQAAGHKPAACFQPSLRHARRWALRARGFLAISCELGATGFLVTTRPSGLPRHVH